MKSACLSAILLLVGCVAFVESDDAACKPCNAPVDHLLVELNKVIEADSPVIKDNMTYCHNLSVWGAWTLQRDGDICSTKLNDDADCYEQVFDFKFKWINFTCVLNMEIIKREIMDKQGTGIAKAGAGIAVQATNTRGRRGLFDGKAGVPKIPEGGNLVGHWVKLGVIGKTKLCKKDAGKSEVEPFVLKDRFNFQDLECSCSGDRTVQQLCQGPEAMQYLKEGIGAAVQTVAADIVRNMIIECKHGMASKLNCGWDK